MSGTVIFIAVVTQAQTKPPVPAGTPIKSIAKFAPGEYQANRSKNTLPKVSSMSAKIKSNFTGIIWPNAIQAPAEFENGKRIYRGSPAVKRGESVDAYLKTQKNGGELRYSTHALTGFTVKLPGDEAKLSGFEGTLNAVKLSIMIRGGKVEVSTYSQHK